MKMFSTKNSRRTIPVLGGDGTPVAAAGEEAMLSASQSRRGSIESSAPSVLSSMSKRSSRSMRAVPVLTMAAKEGEEGLVFCRHRLAQMIILLGHRPSSSDVSV